MIGAVPDAKKLNLDAETEAREYDQSTKIGTRRSREQEQWKKGREGSEDHHCQNEGLVAMESMAMAVLSTSSLPVGDPQRVSHLE